ncbi:unnamed protein product [Orchesella dallaii]|uniref:Uncharacterized protein n=1 Tax=Orchesella dallaii TaxID=48710 RepID=A0ABP1S1N8_9HEXA
MAVGSAFVPFAFGACVCVGIEPTHAMLQEWLEVNISFKPKFIPFILFMAWIVSDAANTVFVMSTLCFLYLVLGRTVASGMTPQSVTKTVLPNSSKVKFSVRYNLNTRYFGVLDDMTIIRMFRTEQVINSWINSILGSILVSAHHVAYMLTLIGAAVTLLRATEEVIDGGILPLAVMLIGVFAPLCMEYAESVEISELCDKSDGFVRSCIHMTDRRTMLYKFAKSCPKLRVHTAYPFYNISRDTFPQFLSQVQEFLISILAV